MSRSSGTFLRKIRNQLQLNMRDVQKMSLTIARGEQNKRFYIPISRLAKIENDESTPNQFKLFTLSSIYGIAFEEILRRYGVSPDRIHRYRSEIKLSATRPVSTEIHSWETKVTVPVSLDPSFKWQSTQLINRVVARWGEIPAAFLIECNPKRHMYAYIGLDDDTMMPLLRPGSLVTIDPERRDVLKGGWRDEYERPIYLVELRDGYLCGWCQVEGLHLTVVPYPTSTAPLRTFRLSTEAEVIGQVVGVAMRLVPPIQADSEHAPTSLRSSDLPSEDSAAGEHASAPLKARKTSDSNPSGAYDRSGEMFDQKTGNPLSCHAESPKT